MRVAIVVPTGVMVHTRFALSLAALVGATPDTDFAIVNPKSSFIASSRNKGVRESLKCAPDYVLFLDSDMSFPANALVRLARADKDVIGCNYVMRNPPHVSLACPKGSAKQSVSGIVEVDRLPTGLMLIKAAVFDKLAWPPFSHRLLPDGELLGEDYYFCDQLREAGVSLWMDTDLSLEVVHWGEMGFRWSDNGYDLVDGDYVASS